MRKTRSRVRAGVVHAGNLNQRTLVDISLLTGENVAGGFVRHATTSDGRTLETSSEAWRLYCEACFVLSLPDKSDKRKTGWKATSKREYLAGVRDKRGQSGHDALRAEMVRLWKLRYPKSQS